MRIQSGTNWDSQTSRSWTDKSRTLRSRTSRSPDIQVPGHPGPRTSRSFGHPGLSDFQVPGHPGPRTSKSFGHPGPRTSRSFGLPGLILNCQNVHQVMFPHQSVKVSHRSQVSRVALVLPSQIPSPAPPFTDRFPKKVFDTFPNALPLLGSIKCERRQSNAEFSISCRVNISLQIPNVHWFLGSRQIHRSHPLVHG